jgi:hypothetical protein
MKMRGKFIIDAGNIKEGIGLDSVCTTNLLNDLSHNIMIYNSRQYIYISQLCENFDAVNKIIMNLI